MSIQSHSPEIEQKIRERAYEIYEYRRDIGLNLIFEKGELRELTPLDDWLEAEREQKIIISNSFLKK